MKTRLFWVFSATLFLLTCSSTPTTPTPPNPPIKHPNWSLYAGDPTYPAIWQTNNPYTSDFTNQWTINGLSEAINTIGPSNWAAAVGSLKSTSPFTNITSFTGYDRKALHALGNPINANCSTAQPGLNNIPSEATSAFVCNVYAQNSQGQPLSGQCYFYKQLGSSSTTLVTPQSPAVLSNNTCTITSNTTYQTSCQIDSSKTNGFSCSSWTQKTTDLSSVNLKLNNLYDSGNPIGCMSPATIVNTLTQWGGLGIGNQITYEDPSVTTPTEQPAYLDATIMYANPYNNDDISGIATPIPDASQNLNYSILAAWNTFCSSHTSFCQAPNNGTSTGGLAHIVGQAGPISLTKYVRNLKQANPTGYYTWQYDDAAGQTICNSANTQTVGIFCPSATPLNSSTTNPIFANSPSRFAVYNNCPYDIWVQAKSVPASPPVPAYCTPLSTTPTQTVDADDCLVHLPSGSAHRYTTPEKGLQSFNIWSKTGCDSTGFNCKTGETGDNGQAGGNTRTHGPQPDIETAIEGTFGCTLSSGCEQTGNGSTLGSSTYLDVTFVNGFTRPAQLQVIKGSDETNIACNSTPTPNLDISLCPTNEDLTTRANSQ